MTNGDDNTISIIDGKTNSVTANKVYVANSGDNTISIIDGKTNSIVDKITVGYSPFILDVNPYTRMVYATNKDNGILYEINGTTDKVIVGTDIRINPPTSGQIDCGGKKLSNNNYIFVNIGTQCTPIPNRGFIFTSWSGSLASNSNNNSQTIFPVTKYGTLSANFERPATTTIVTLPQGYWDSLYAILTSIIIIPIVSWLVPYIAKKDYVDVIMIDTGPHLVRT